jgi:putative transposase
VEAFLNGEEQRRARRRRPHHLPAEFYVNRSAVYCVTLCARHHGQPFLDARLAAAVTAAVRFYRERGLWMVYTFCLMPDHLHAVVRLGEPVGPEELRWDEDPDAPPRGLKRRVGNFKRYTTTQIAWRHGLRGRLWQRDFYDHIARGEAEFEAQCRYVLENPVRKELVTRWEDYPWAGVLDPWV